MAHDDSDPAASSAATPHASQAAQAYDVPANGSDGAAAHAQTSSASGAAAAQDTAWNETHNAIASSSSKNRPSSPPTHNDENNVASSSEHSHPHRSMTAPPPRLEFDMDPEDTEGFVSLSPPSQQRPLAPSHQYPPSSPSGSEDGSDATVVSSASDSDSPTSDSGVPRSALRRASSAVHVGPNGHTRTRKHKHLRFTAMTAGSLTISTPTDPSHMRKHGVPRDQEWFAGELDENEPPTPNISETADQIRRVVSLASLDTLIMLQKHRDERDRFIAGVRRAGRDLVWRGQDEKKVYPHDAERICVLAAKRGLRSFLVAFHVRAGVNLLLLLFKARRKRLQLRDVWHAIFGEESLRFGAMLGSFTFLNTLTYHMLRIAPPLSYVRRRILRILQGRFDTPTYGPPLREGNEGERRWHAALAGAVGSLGLLWESAGRRRSIAQQMLVRGLQGAYNQYTPQMGIHIPHGNIVLFGLCCGQIMFAFLLSPDTLPKEYRNWIQSASGVPPHAVMSNRTTVRQNLIRPQEIEAALEWHGGVTPKNRTELLGILDKIKEGWDPKHHITCAVTHPWSDSCSWVEVQRFIRTFRFMLPVYGALHLVPMLVFRRHAFAKSPLRLLLRVILGVTRSCSFLGLFICINQTLFCMRSRVMESAATPLWLNALLARKENFWIMGFLNALSLFAEESRRRTELAMYVLPRALESGWSSARRRSWVPIVPFGEAVLGAAAMAMVMDSYKHKPEALSGIVRRLLYQIVGPV